MRAADSIALTCDANAGRTRLSAIRCEGLSRASRAFAAPHGAIRLMLSALGPGVLAGMIVSPLTARWRSSFAHRVRPNGNAGVRRLPMHRKRARLGTWPTARRSVVASEPLLLEPDCEHAASASFAIDGSGSAIVVDTFGLRGSARLSMRTTATLDGRLVYRDAYDIAGDLAGAFGTVTLIAAGAAARNAFLARARDIAASAAERAHRLRRDCSAAAIVRLHGTRVWDVRAAALRIAAATTS